MKLTINLNEINYGDVAVKQKEQRVSTSTVEHPLFFLLVIVRASRILAAATLRVFSGTISTHNGSQQPREYCCTNEINYDFLPIHTANI